MQHRLKAEVFAISKLSLKQQTMMYNLYSKYYEGFDQELFYRDLQNKHWAIILLDSFGNIRGFTTLLINKHIVNSQPVHTVFSGDTIIHHDFWGEQILPHAWCKFVGGIKASLGDSPLYWFLIVKGHRTYRYLRVFSKQFYPTVSKATPEKIQIIMDHLGTEQFGDNYQAGYGVIKFNRSHGYLKKEWAGMDDKTLTKPDVKFFLERNPNCHRGEELVCLTELTEKNLQRHALTAFREGLISV